MASLLPVLLCQMFVEQPVFQESSKAYNGSLFKLSIKNYVYQIIHRLVELPLPDYIIPARHATRGNSMKLVHPATNIDSYKYSFFPNSIGVWNKFPAEIVH